MKSLKLVICFHCTVMLLADAQSSMAAEKVSKQEQSQWLRWVIPLPKKISISRKVTVPASEVKITVSRGAGDTEKTAADQLAALFKEKGKSGGNGEAFEILIGVCDSGGKVEDVELTDATNLKNLPNKEQAYLVRPVGQNRLVLTALDERGVYYAVQTLRQLLESQFDKGTVTIPLVSVTDWPDIAKRGEWGGNICATDEMLWMARHKMNLIQYEVVWSIGDDGRGRISRIKQPAKYAPARIQEQVAGRSEKEMRAFGNRHAIHMDPSLMHYSLLGERTRIFDVYPELKEKVKPRGKWIPAVGEVEVRYIPCPSQPKMVDLLADFMLALAKAGATEIDCCVTEGSAQCDCEKCHAEGVSGHALETRAYVNAWRRAAGQYPNLKIRISLSQGSFRTNNAKVLAEIPPGVGAIYYEGGRTYNSTRAPMINPLLEAFAAKGGYLGVVPQLTASYAVVSPWTGPQFIKYRMNEFVDKKLRTLVGYATPTNRLYDFNVTATAEWSWNAKGRSAREFALAWATRRGLKDPEAAADWAEMLGPVSWDVYGSAIPYPHFRDKKAGNLVPNRSRPVLGKESSMFRYFPTTEHIEHDLAVCDKAMEIAKRLGSPAILHETRVIQGYVRIVKGIYTIATQVCDLASPTYADRVKLQEAMNRLTVARFETIDGLEQWERSIGLGLSGYRRFSENTMEWVEQTIDVIGDSLVSSFGVREFTSPYFRKKIGEWTTKDFNDKKVIEKKWDVTQQMPPSGSCEVTLVYLPDSPGAYIGRVALVSASEGTPDRLTEVSVDTHDGYAGKRGVGTNSNIYTVTLKKHNPDLRYFILADIRTEDERKCNGAAWIRAVSPTGWNPAKKAEELRPMTDKELAELEKADLPEFTGKGLRVGVVQEGYGSTSIFNYLRTVDGIDVQPLSSPNKAMIETCQMVVLPILKRDGQGQRMSDSLMDTFRDYVRGGGGLVLTAALGEMGLGRYPTICKFKRHSGDYDFIPWRVQDEHPVTRGIEMNKELPGTGFSVEYELGQKGVAVARSVQSGDPVVVAGEFGQGRLVICGLDLRFKGDATHKAKKTLLNNAVKWCGRKKQ